MSDLLPFIVIGLSTGSIYSLAAMGLTLTYRTTGVFNFAQGAIGAVAAYLFFDLTRNGGMSWPLAAAVSIVVVGVLGGAALERLGSVLLRVSVAMQIAATVGLMVGLQGLIVLRYGAATISTTPFLPTDAHEFAGTQISTDQIITVAVVLVVGLGLSAVFRFSRLGATTRAVVDDPDLLALTGTSPSRARRWSWIIGTVFAAAAGILAAGSLGTLDPGLLTLLLVSAFGASAIGGFRSLLLTYVGGLAVGVLAALATKYISGEGIVAGLPAATPVIVLFVTLLVVPRRYLGSRAVLRLKPTARRASSPTALRVAGTVAALAVAIAAPAILGSARVPALTGTAVFTVLFLSLILLVRFSGQVSLAQYGFMAVGAAAFYKLAGEASVPWPLAVLLAGLVAVPVGALVAIPAVRLSGLFLALATFGFGVLLQQLFYTSDLMFTNQPSVPSPRPGFAESDRAYYYVVLAVTVAMAALVLAIDRSRLGRLLRGLQQSPMTLTTSGTNLAVTKLIVFSISAFVAGIAGALFGPISESVNSLPFEPLNSLQLVAILLIAGSGTVRPAVIGGFALALIPSYITSAETLDYLPVLYAVAAIGVTVAESQTVRLPPWLPRLGRRRRTATIVAARPQNGESR